MADGEANDGCAANDIVELEAMRKDGLSWHPCQVSLCSRGLGLIVLYENDSQERITDKQEIFARIRVRSTPLQGDDCSSIRQGEHVLATKSSQVDGVFYDARMEKVIHVRHSKRIHCRCSFTIKWLHRSFPDEALTVPASAIMKLATKNINLHPTIAAFISSQEPSNALDAAPCLEIAEGNNWEMDINVLLEQQIKKISTSHVPQENFLKDCVSEHKADLGGQSHGWEIKASSIISLGSISVLDKLNSFNGSENTQPVESILDKSPVSTPSIQEEELRGTRFLINPLAARAALASLRSESPQTPEFSARSSEKVDMTGYHSVANLHQGSKLCSFSAVDCSSNGEKKSLNISAALEGKSPNLRSISKKLFPTSSPPHIVEILNPSPGSQMNGMEEKKTRLSGVKRLARSQIQRDSGVHGTQQLTNNNETELRLTETRRVTRSRVKGSEKTEAEEYNAGKDHVHNESTLSETFPHSAIAPDNLKAVSSPINVPTNPQRLTRSRVKGVETPEVSGYDAAAVDGMVVDDDTEKGHMIQDAGKNNIPKRLTRSAAIKNAESDTEQLQPNRRKNNSIESATEINEKFAEEGESRKISTRVKTTPKNSESSGGSDCGTRQRSASSTKQETRFSPRLRQQAQSQNKA